MLRTSFESGPAARNKGLAVVRSFVSDSASQMTARFAGLPRAHGGAGRAWRGRTAAPHGDGGLGSPVWRDRSGDMRFRLAHAGRAVLLALGLTMPGCSTLNSVTNAVTGGGGPAPGTPGYVSGFLGGVAADEPRAALAAREVLSSGGTAADAAVAAGYMLTVTLPSRAGLGAGGACLAYDPDKASINGGVPEALLFVSSPGGGGGARPAAVPMLARGLFALQARYGRLPFDGLTIYAEQAARFGVPLSRAFARDLAVVAGPLAGDPLARAIFFQPDGTPLTEGMNLVQPDLGATLAQLRVAGVGDLYVGALSRKLLDAAARAEGGLTPSALRDSLPRFAPALAVDAPRGDQAVFLPPPADGGLAADAAFRVLLGMPGALKPAQDRALAVAAAWRAQRGQGDPAALLAGQVQLATLPLLPASTSLVTLDRDGRAVACAFTMNNLFGTGRIAPGTGVLLAASPSWMPPALLAAGMTWNAHIHAFRAAVAGSGQEGAPLAVADSLLQTGRATQRMVSAPGPMPGPNNQYVQGTGALVTSAGTEALRPAPEPGRSNIISCAGYLPGDKGSCAWITDPRGAGLAVGSN